MLPRASEHPSPTIQTRPRLCHLGFKTHDEERGRNRTFHHVLHVPGDGWSHGRYSQLLQLEEFYVVKNSLHNCYLLFCYFLAELQSSRRHRDSIILSIILPGNFVALIRRGYGHVTLGKSDATRYHPRPHVHSC